MVWLNEVRKLFNAIVDFVLKILWKLFLIDHEILKRSPRKEKERFAVSGMLLFLIFVISCFSGIYLSYLIFEQFIIALLIGTFLSWNILNIYRFILSTISSNRLPHLEKSKSFQISVVLRIIYLIGLAIMISKPLELYFFEPQIEVLMVDYKAQRINEFKENNLSFLSEEINRIDGELTVIDQSARSEQEINKRKKSLEKDKSALQNKKEAYLRSFISTNARANYLIPRLKLLHQNIAYTWGISFCILLFLIGPIAIKMSTVKTSDYERRVDNLDFNLIMREYNTFKHEFESCFASYHGTKITFYEGFRDPPFNTKPKQKTITILDKEALMKELSKGKE